MQKQRGRKMRKFLFAVSAIAALSLLLVSGSSIAEPTSPNEIGLYMTPDGYGATGTLIVGDPVTVYMVLTRPEKNGIPYETINAFECRLTFDPIGNLFKLGDIFPPQAINIGDNSHIGDGYLEYIVGLGTDLPVTDESVVLIEFLFLHYAPGVIEVSLGPVSAPSIPGWMAYQSVNGDLRVMYSIAGGIHDAPVFLFDGFAIPVETESFGSVKALYR